MTERRESVGMTADERAYWAERRAREEAAERDADLSAALARAEAAEREAEGWERAFEALAGPLREAAAPYTAGAVNGDDAAACLSVVLRQLGSAEARVAELESTLERWLEDATGVREQAAAQSLTERAANNQRVWEFGRRLGAAEREAATQRAVAQRLDAQLHQQAETLRAAEAQVERLKAGIIELQHDHERYGRQVGRLRKHCHQSDSANHRHKARIAELEARVRELEERAALPKSTQRNLARFDSMAALIERKAQHIAALIAAGDRMAEIERHHKDCRSYLRDPTSAWCLPYPCDCGARDAVAAWERAKEGQS